jgi:hypothetical protein
VQTLRELMSRGEWRADRFQTRQKVT